MLLDGLTERRQVAQPRARAAEVVAGVVPEAGMTERSPGRLAHDLAGHGCHGEHDAVASGLHEAGEAMHLVWAAERRGRKNEAVATGNAVDRCRDPGGRPRRAAGIRFPGTRRRRLRAIPSIGNGPFPADEPQHEPKPRLARNAMGLGGLAARGMRAKAHT